MNKIYDIILLCIVDYYYTYYLYTYYTFIIFIIHIIYYIIRAVWNAELS